MRLFHYACGVHVESILEDRAIRPTAVGIDADEHPAVWLGIGDAFAFVRR